jgi:hypothetical protein
MVSGVLIQRRLRGKELVIIQSPIGGCAPQAGRLNGGVEHGESVLSDAGGGRSPGGGGGGGAFG